MVDPIEGPADPPSPPPGRPLDLGKLRDMVTDFCKNTDEPTVREYAVVLALIIVVCLAAKATLQEPPLSAETPVPAPEQEPPIPQS